MTTDPSRCPECNGSPDLPSGERCYLCNTKSNRVDGRASGAVTSPPVTGKPSTGTKAGASSRPPRPKVPAKKRSTRPRRRHHRGYPKWARAITQPVLGICVAGCVIHIASLLIV